MSQTTSAEPTERVWQRLWFTLRQHRWTTVAVIGTADARSVEKVAHTLADVGIRDEKTPVEVISALGMPFHDTAALVARIEARTGEQDFAIVACDSPGTNPAMIPVLGAVNAVVLVVGLGDASLEAVRRLADDVGRDKVLATVTVG